ncbi:MAG: MgtC/SapB family protein [Clostridia bacterium]|nr:MgtC/SapB family protein [Clostridia bacterium]
MDILLDFNTVSTAVRLLLALLLGGLIGLERGIHGRAAGLRTHVLVSLGSCMTALIGLYIHQELGIGEQVTRIAAQVISGIGFLGAGTILVKNQSVITGLTTAAGVWCTAAIGIALGYGFYVGAILCSLVVIVTATVLTRLERRQKGIRHFYLELKDPNLVTKTIRQIQDRFPNVQAIEIVAPKSGLANVVGLSLTMAINFKIEEPYLTVLDEMDNVLFATED